LHEEDVSPSLTAADECVRVPEGEGVSVRERPEVAITVVQVDAVVDGIAPGRNRCLSEDVGCAVSVEVGDRQVLDVVETLQMRVLREPGGRLVAEGAVPVADQDLHDAADVPLRVAVDKRHRSARRGNDEIDMPVAIQIDRLDVEGLGRSP
jgi:hypothetical protein